MGKAVNRVFLIGRLTRDIEVKSTTTGKSVGSFTLAVDKATAPQGDGPTADFFDCVAWEKTAELLQQYTAKGSKIHVEGSLQQRSWEQDGQKRSKVEVVVRDITFLDNKSDNASSTPASTTKKDDVVEDVGDDPINLDDIPF